VPAKAGDKLLCNLDSKHDGSDFAAKSIWKTGIFSPGKKIEDLRGGVHRYAALC
jgi:hypothetical protein